MRKSMMLVLAATLAAATVQAQQEKEKIKVKTGDPKPWTVKWNPGSLIAGNISLHSEYNYKNKKSVTFGVGIPLERTYSRTEDGDKTELRHKVFSLQGGYRMYLGKKSMKGFYFEPFLKYINYQGVGTATYREPGINGDNVYDITVKHNSFGVGAQLGVQFMLGNVVSFDIFLVGPQANIAKTNGTFFDRNNNLPWTSIERDEAEREIRDALDDLPLVGKQLADNLKVDQSARTVTTNYSGFLPGFRFGGSIGIHF